MNLEKLLHIYLDQAKKQALTLCDIERTIVCQWIKKIELAPINQEINETQKLQLNSLKLLLLTIESNCLVGPFGEGPVDGKEFTEYNWDSYQLEDFSNMIRSKRDVCKRPEVSYAVSADRRELVTYQNDPAAGQHCYYACSRQPIEGWDNLQGGAIKKQSIDNWKERAEFEELNDKDSSIDNPRCVMQPTNSEVDLNDEQYPNSSRFQRVQNSSNYFENPSEASGRYDRTHKCRPETPQRFGGRGQTKRPYEIEQFGLSQNEQFRSPRGVFQNLDYDRFQSHRNPMPPRLTDEVVESFENARVNCGPLSEVEQNDARKQLCARLQKIRDGMNKKPEVEIEQQIEVEPEVIPFERITLQEPCEDITQHDYDHETEQDLGILSPGEMDDEVLFGEHQTIDPRTVFKTRDENLVSRNVVKIETKTTINGSKREVTEEILEQEDVNVVNRTDKDDENLVDVSKPTFESTVGRSPEQWRYKPRRVLTDYSDLPQEDLEDISRPSFEQGSSYQEHECIPRNQNQIYSGRQPGASQKPNLTESERRSTRGHGRVFHEGDHSERLENISEPIYPTSFENSGQRTCANQPDGYQSFEESTNKSKKCKCLSHERPMIQIETMDKLEEESQPVFERSSKDYSGFDGNMQPCRRLPQVEALERLDEVSQPSFLHSTEVSHKESSQRSRYLQNQRPLPQMELSERLDEVSHPGFLSSIEESYQGSTRRNGRCPLSKRAMPIVDTSEKLEQVTNPSFMSSFQDSRILSRQNRNSPQLYPSEKLDEMSQPELVHSIEEDSLRRTRCPLNRRSLPQEETSERLDNVSQPGFSSSFGEGRSRFPICRRGMPQIHTTDKLDEISKPSFDASFQDSTIPSRRGRLLSTHRGLPPVETSERLDDVNQPEFVHSTEESYEDTFRRTRCPLNRRSLPQEEKSERLDNVSQPGFSSSFGDTFQDSTGRSRFPISRRAVPQVDTTEKLDEISKPSFDASFQYYTLISPHKRLPPVEASERLDDISQPGLLHSTEVSYQDPSRRSRCPKIQRHSPQVETSERLDNVSYPSFLTSNEDTFQDSTGRGRCPIGRRALPQVDESEELDQISQPSFGASIQNSTGLSRQGRLTSTHRRLPAVETTERLDDVTQPGFLSSTEASVQNFDGRTKCPMNRRGLPQMETSERLDQVSQPGFLSSSIEGTNEDCRRRCKCQLSQRPLPQVNLSEELDQVSQPKYIASEGASSFDDSFQESGKQTRDRNSFRQVNVSQNPPFCPYSAEDCKQISRKNKQTSVEDYDDDEPLRHRPNIEESEILDAVTQPELTSFEDTGYESKDSCQILPQRPLSQIEESERLDDISQPCFQSSYKDSTFRSNLDSRRTQDKRPLPFVETSERLSNICKPDFFNSHQTQSTGYENLEDVCQPSFQSTFEDSNQKDKHDIHRQTPHQHLQTSAQESSGRKQNPRQRLLSRVDGSELLDNVTQPFYPSSFEDSMCDGDRRHVLRRYRETRLNSTSHRPFVHGSESEYLDNVTEPGFQSSFEGSRPTASIRQKTIQELPRDKIDTQEELNDISQPTFPTSFEDSRRYVETPKRRPLPLIDASENLEDVCYPSFESSLNRSRRPEEISMRKPFSQVDESEILDDISQPSGFPCSRGSRLHPSKTASSDRLPLRSPKQSSVRQRPFPQIDNSERLNEISQPDFATTIKSTTQRSMCPSEQCCIRQRLDDVCQPSLPYSSDCSSRYSRRNESRQNQEPIPRYVDQSDVSRYPDRSDRKPRHLPIQFDTSEMLEDITQPGFSSIFHGSSNTSRERQRTDTGNRPVPQINLSENIDSVCQPSFPSSLGDSTRNEVYQLSSTYRKNKDYMTNLPKEHVIDISAPTFDFTYEDSTQRPRGYSYLPQENLEDVSCPSFQTTPKAPSRFRNQDYQCPRGPPRQLFPKQESTNREQMERSGDFRQVFETMPNYAPFQQQVAPKGNPTASRLKMPVSSAPLTRNEESHRTQMGYPCCRPHPSQPNERPSDGDCHLSRIRPSNIREAYPSTRNRKEPGPTVSSTRIPPPPSARAQASVQGQDQRLKQGKQANQERLVKKSSVKFHQTKSTYFKNKQDQLNRNQRR